MRGTGECLLFRELNILPFFLSCLREILPCFGFFLCRFGFQYASEWCRHGTYTAQLCCTILSLFVAVAVVFVRLCICLDPKIVLTSIFSGTTPSSGFSVGYTYRNQIVPFTSLMICAEAIG